MDPQRPSAVPGRWGGAVVPVMGASPSPGPRVVHIQKAKTISGSEGHLLTLLPALRDAGVDARMLVLLAPGGEGFVDAMADAGVPRATIPAGPHLDPVLLRRVLRVLQADRPVLVHTHLIHGDTYGQVAAAIAGIPGVSTVHGVRPHLPGAAADPLRALSGRMARRTIAISHHVGRHLVARRLVPAARLRVVHYGIDLGGVEQGAPGRDDLPMVLVASRLIAGKGHDVLLDAWGRRTGPEARLCIAGDGPLRPELEDSAAGLVGVEFLGYRRDMAALMAASEIVVFPTTLAFGEGFGLVTLEAMAAGRPVVGTDAHATPEIVVDGETGLLVPPGDPQALARALDHLLADRAAARRMGEAGRRRALSHFSVETMVAATMAVYQEVTDD